MSSEILAVLEYMEREKGIDRQTMIPVIATSIKTAAEKGINSGQELKVEINPKTGVLKAWALTTVVDPVSDPKTEITLTKARKIRAEAQIGDTIEREIDPAYLGRIAAQTARQAIMQRIREFEKERIYDAYKDQIGDIVSGVVRRRERGILIVDLGKAEAILPNRESIPGENYSPGERIRCLLLSIENTNRGPELILSRTSPQFVKRLFEVEVAEIADGTVTIQSVAREPSYRTKICVHSKDPKVDPVGACVGARGVRVKTVVRELGGEKVDVIDYHSDPVKLLEAALRPTVPQNVHVDEANRRIHFEVDERGLANAIGKRGQNARLTSKLIGWKLNIAEAKKQNISFDQRLQRAIAVLRHVGIEADLAKRLVSVGFTSVDAFEGVAVNDLKAASQCTEDQAQHILKKIAEFQDSSGAATPLAQ